MLLREGWRVEMGGLREWRVCECNSVRRVEGGGESGDSNDIDERPLAVEYTTIAVVHLRPSFNWSFWEATVTSFSFDMEDWKGRAMSKGLSSFGNGYSLVKLEG